MISAVAASGTAYTASAADTVAQAASLTLNPSSPSLIEGATQQFTTNVGATFSASCGSITSGGLYTAPLTPASCTVTASATDGSGHTASTAATVTSPIIISPSTAATSQGQTQQFSANSSVTWGASCGSINSGGLFTATATSGSVCTISAVAASGTAYTASAIDTVGSATALTISPLYPTVSEGGTQQFTSSVQSNWTATCGSIVASSGLYTAPLAAGPCAVTANATDGSGHTASTTAAVTSPIVITPSSTTTGQGQTQQFTASAAVTWTTSCGGIDQTGLFTASTSQGNTCTITATASSGTAYATIATDTVAAPPAFTLSPLNPTIVAGATQPFTTSVPATFTASCGSIDPTGGLYTGPMSTGTCSVVATATDGTARTAGTSVSITGPMTVTPTAVNLHAMNTQQFTASQAATWSSSCGSISGSGVFTAPSSASSCTITATAADGSALTVTAKTTVDVANYTAWKGGGGNLGAQTNELALTSSNVNASSFGLSWTTHVDAWVNAQPLYMNALTVNGTPHNAVFVVTANDSVYALDGDTGAQLWQVSLIPSGATAVAGSTVGFTSAPLIGILGTPVVDPSTNTMYVVSETSEQNATYFPHRLHALDVTTGNEKFGGPVVIDDPQMAPMHKLQRPGLLLANGNIYVAIGSMQDMQSYHGFIFSFNAQTLAQQAVWNATPNGSEGGVWMGGAAPSVDGSGNIYLTTGNGTLDGTANFGEAAVKLSPGLQVLDYFAPYNFATYNLTDLDLGSGDVMVVPDQNGTYPHELIVCGKPTPIYVLNRDNLGQLGTTSDNIIQRLDNEVGAFNSRTNSVQACFTAPAMWGQNVYFGGKYDVLKLFTLDPNSGLLSSSPVSQGSLAYGYPGGNPVVSANGSTNGIVWTIDTGTNALIASDATNVASTLFSGSVTGALRWTVPTVINGHVYAAGQGTVYGFALK
jgi:hypothetical protein